MMFRLIGKLEKTHSLTIEEYMTLIEGRNEEFSKILADKAVSIRKSIYGDKIYIRGLIEISNFCRNDCYYCGIRKSNDRCDRYRLSGDDINRCVDMGYSLGFRTFVLQGGEDMFFTDDVMCGIVSDIKKRHPDCAVTLSIGERTEESYRKLFEAGADRYLLRHETADEEHYKKLHPDSMSFSKRMRCLEQLKKIGYQVGCGFMVGSPGQSSYTLAKDLKFIEEFSPDMCGIGPFIPHKDTKYCDKNPGSTELTCYLLSLIRLIKPEILLPATTALGTVSENGRERGILAGANVVMPNLSPAKARERYALYDNKLYTGAESAEHVKELADRMKKTGYRIVIDKGDARR